MASSLCPFFRENTDMPKIMISWDPIIFFWGVKRYIKIPSAITSKINYIFLTIFQFEKLRKKTAGFHGVLVIVFDTKLWKNWTILTSIIFCAKYFRCFLNPRQFSCRNSDFFMLKIIFKNKKYELGGVLVLKTSPYIYIHGLFIFLEYCMQNILVTLTIAFTQQKVTRGKSI